MENLTLKNLRTKQVQKIQGDYLTIFLQLFWKCSKNHFSTNWHYVIRRYPKRKIEIQKQGWEMNRKVCIRALKPMPTDSPVQIFRVLLIKYVFHFILWDEFLDCILLVTQKVVSKRNSSVKNLRNNQFSASCHMRKFLNLLTECTTFKITNPNKNDVMVSFCFYPVDWIWWTCFEFRSDRLSSQ